MVNVSASAGAEPSFAELLEASFARDEVAEGEIVRGIVVSVHKDHVLSSTYAARGDGLTD